MRPSDSLPQEWVCCPFQVRPSPQQSQHPNPNLFVRLSPLALQTLLQNGTESVADWSTVEFLPLEIRFPKQDTRNTREEDDHSQVIYASYNGGLLDPSSDDDPSTPGAMMMELPQDFMLSASPSREGRMEASSLFNSTDHDACIRILPMVPNATSVHVEPLTVPDWKILQQEASWLEQGGLLRQISVLSTNQIVPLYIPPKKNRSIGVVEVAHIRVTAWESTDPSINMGRHAASNTPHRSESTQQHSDSEWQWPELSDNDEEETDSPVDNTDSTEGLLCCRLLAQAEIIVAPKEEEESSDQHQVLLSLCPTWQDYSLSMHKLYDDLVHQSSCSSSPLAIPSVPQGTVLVHSDTLTQLLDQNAAVATTGIDPESCYVRVQVLDSSQRMHPEEVDSDGENQQDFPQHTTPRKASIVALAKSCTSVPLNFIAVHPLFCETLQIYPLVGRNKVSLTVVPSFEVELRSEQLAHIIEQGEVELALSPIRTDGLDIGRNALLEDLVLPNLAPFSTRGLLLTTGSSHGLPRIYKLELGSSNQLPLSLYQEPLLLGRDLDKFIHNGKVGTRAPETAAPLHSNPTRQSTPPILDLLPAPTTIPSKLLESARPNGLRDCNMLIHGPSGSGKTQTAMIVAAMARFSITTANQDGRGICRTVRFDCRDQKDNAENLDEILNRLTALFESAAQNIPCIVILDDLDEICPNLRPSSLAKGGSSSQVDQASSIEIEQAKVIGDHIQNLLDCSNGADEIAIMATSRDIGSVEWNFRKQNLRKKIKLPLLTPSEKVSMLNDLFRASSTPDIIEELTMSSAPSNSRVPLEFMLRDLMPKDIEMIFSRVAHEINDMNSNGTAFASLLSSTLENYIPLSRRSAAEEPRDSFFNWHDIGGLSQAKKALDELVVRPIKFRRIYETSKIRLPKGILLFGPSGCGKSILPTALAKLMGLPLIFCRGPEILDKYIGASEAKIRALFERAAMAAPSILFLDEIDSLAPHRGSDLTGVTDRVVNQLLTFLDGVEDVSSGKTVYVIGSSSRPDKIDAALLRPGRLEKHVYVGPPESIGELIDVFAKIGNKYLLDPYCRDGIVSGELIRQGLEMVPHLQNFSSSDVKAVLDTAQIKTVRDYLACHDETERDMSSPPLIRQDFFLDALCQSRPSLGESDRRRLNQIYDRFRGRRDKTKDHEDRPLRVALK